MEVTTVKKPTEAERAAERHAALGKAIKRFRGSATQAQLGALLDVPQTTISRWEAGSVDLGLEQIRAIELALELPLGTVGRAAGFVDPGLTGDEDCWPGFRVGFFDRVEEAQAELAAAATLDLGVRIFN